jgi:hypothetical protein
MRQYVLFISLIFTLFLLAACSRETPAPQQDMGKLRQAVQQKTEQLYFIHLKLDSAAKSLAEAESRARQADCGDAEYHAADAYDYLVKADEDLIALGQELQALFNLDAE